MKKLIISLIFMIITGLSAYCQTEKRTVLVGGYANFSFNTNENIFLSLDPNSGLFIADKFCLGISVPIIYVNDDFFWGFTPFAKYYFKEKSKTSFFILGAVGLTSLLESHNAISPGLITAGIGHIWFINQSIGFAVDLRGGTSFEDVDIGLHFGIQVFLNKNNE